MIPKPIRVLGTTTGLVFGGLLTLRIISSLTVKVVGSIVDNRQKKFAVPCGECRGKGFYICKLCNGNATIQWSPMYDPLVINPCLCPTCDGHREEAAGHWQGRSGWAWADSGHRSTGEQSSSTNGEVQRCLNCLGKGYC
ncbi:hypothetical protein ACFE04_011090 [Oxalis oulophora]